MFCFGNSVIGIFPKMRASGIPDEVYDMSAAQAAAVGALMSGRVGKASTMRSQGNATQSRSQQGHSSTQKESSNEARLFVGNLGNEVTDDLLSAAFTKYKSFRKAQVIRNKFGSLKSKGYGFASFADPRDMLAALKEMNGKHIGTRPVQIKRSDWSDKHR